MVKYTHRLSVLTKLRTYEITDDVLMWEDEDGKRGSLDYDDILQMDGKFDPSRSQLNKYVLKIRSRNRPTLEITNTTFNGFNDFSEHSDEFRDFSIALHQKISMKNPSVNFKKGSTPIGYILSILTTLFIGIVLLIAALYFFTSGMYTLVMIKFFLVTFYLPSLFRYLKNNVPATYDPQNIPAEMLP